MYVLQGHHDFHAIKVPSVVLETHQNMMESDQQLRCYYLILNLFPEQNAALEQIANASRPGINTDFSAAMLYVSQEVKGKLVMCQSVINNSMLEIRMKEV
jgi:hypothetical protein